MDIPILLEDLIKDFGQGRTANLQAIEQTDRLVVKIKKPLAYRFFQAGFSLALELLLWIAMVACLAAIMFMEKLYPFSILGYLRPPVDHPDILPDDIHLLVWTLRGLFLLLGLSFLWTARLLSKRRKAAKAAAVINKDLKKLMEQLLNRRSAIRQLSLKYPVDLAEEGDSVAPPSLNPPKQPGKSNPDDILL